MNCPHCRLANPPSTERCDCGYDFRSEIVEVPNLDTKKAADTPKLSDNEKQPSFLLSTLALLFGLLVIVSGIINFANEQSPFFRSMNIHVVMCYGIPAFFGALAYKSAKKRKLNLVKSSFLRIGEEILLVSAALFHQLWAIVVTPKGFVAAINRDPASTLIPMIWVLLAYYSTRTDFAIRNLVRKTDR